jgi:hypothetical protein
MRYIYDMLQREYSSKTDEEAVKVWTAFKWIRTQRNSWLLSIRQRISEFSKVREFFYQPSIHPQAYI